MTEILSRASFCSASLSKCAQESALLSLVILAANEVAVAKLQRENIEFHQPEGKIGIIRGMDIIL